MLSKQLNITQLMLLLDIDSSFFDAKKVEENAGAENIGRDCRGSERSRTYMEAKYCMVMKIN